MKTTEIIPVIHMTSTDQVLQNVKICKTIGIKKIFLINHSLDNVELLETALLVKALNPQLWVGVNLLGMPTAQAISTDLGNIDGLWCDTVIDPELYKKFRTFKGQMFGSLAFKYQKQPADLFEACNVAKQTCDVATTSGVGTGKSIDLVKLNTILDGLNGFPSAIASGVAEENVHHYAGRVDYLLVASSITNHDEIIDSEKLSNLISTLYLKSNVN